LRLEPAMLERIDAEVRARAREIAGPVSRESVMRSMLDEALRGRVRAREADSGRYPDGRAP
jgi:hypothetical protein